jgi:hypothetical protein
VETLPQADRKPLEHRHCQHVGEIYQILQTASLDKFTHSWIDSLQDELRAIVHELEHLPEAAFKELIGVIDGLGEARNELRLAGFLFEVEEVDPVYRLILRNKAVLRGRVLLHKTLRVWPFQSLP